MVADNQNYNLIVTVSIPFGPRVQDIPHTYFSRLALSTLSGSGFEHKLTVSAYVIFPETSTGS